MPNLLWIAATLIAGTAVGYFLRKLLAKRLAGSVEEKAEKLLAETKTKQRELLLQARDKAIQVID